MGNNMKRKLAKFLLLLLLFDCFLIGCTRFFTPPTAEEADAFLKSNWHDIDTAVNYLKAIDTDIAFVVGTTVKYEFKDHEIVQEDVKTCFQHLWNAGCELISYDVGDNTISFEIWNTTFGNVGCGIACTINGKGFPKAEMQTECKLISYGWYYFVADYEEYRKSPSKYDEMWDAEKIQTQ